MAALLITVDFENRDHFKMIPEAGTLEEKSIPSWAKFSHMPCPGNIEHGPRIDYCRLGVEIENLIKHFSNIESTESGTLVMHYENGDEMRIRSDAQTIFFDSLWFILLHSNCSVFKYSQWARSNYMPSTDPERVFYMLFSIFLIEDYVVSPDKPPAVEHFRAEIHMLRDVLNNLLERVRESSGLTSDSVCNGIVMFSNLMLFLNLKFDEFFHDLEERVKESSVLGVWV